MMMSHSENSPRAQVPPSGTRANTPLPTPTWARSRSFSRTPKPSSTPRTGFSAPPSSTEQPDKSARSSSSSAQEPAPASQQPTSAQQPASARQPRSLGRSASLTPRSRSSGAGHEPEEILAARGSGAVVEYRVKWRGFASSQSVTWELGSQLRKMPGFEAVYERFRAANDGPVKS